MNSSLVGLRILVTRPDPLHQETCSAIAAAGGMAVHFPLMKIESIKAKHDVQSIKSKVEKLDYYQMLIFISNNAAHFGADWINKYWPQFPVGVEVVAIGSSTSRKVSSILNCNVVHSEQGANSEDLLELRELKRVEGKKIAIFRGQNGRELLAHTLQKRGADVDYIEVYKRLPAENTRAQLFRLIIDENINACCITSAESLHRFNEMLEDSTQPEKALREIPLIVPSRRVAEMAEKLGFLGVKNARGADVKATISTLQKLAN